MKITHLTLEDLSRNELLRLMQRFNISPSPSDFLAIRRETLRLKSKKLTEDGLAEMDANMGGDIQHLKNYLRGMHKTERARRLYDRVLASY